MNIQQLPIILYEAPREQRCFRAGSACIFGSIGIFARSLSSSCAPGGSSPLPRIPGWQAALFCPERRRRIPFRCARGCSPRRIEERERSRRIRKFGMNVKARTARRIDDKGGSTL